MNQTLRTDEWQRCALEVRTNTMCQEAMSDLRPLILSFLPQMAEWPLGFRPFSHILPTSGRQVGPKENKKSLTSVPLCLKPITISHVTSDKSVSPFWSSVSSPVVWGIVMNSLKVVGRIQCGYMSNARHLWNGSDYHHNLYTIHWLSISKYGSWHPVLKYLKGTSTQRRARNHFLYYISRKQHQNIHSVSSTSITSHDQVLSG